MNIREKIEYLKNKHLSEFLSLRETVLDELSATQSVFCVCGKLATGLHESMCKKFHLRVDELTANRLYDKISSKEKNDKV